jgi:hypothetical protein
MADKLLIHTSSTDGSSARRIEGAMKGWRNSCKMQYLVTSYRAVVDLYGIDHGDTLSKTRWEMLWVNGCRVVRSLPWCY